jgi:hypothetical protein
MDSSAAALAEPFDKSGFGLSHSIQSDLWA